MAKSEKRNKKKSYFKFRYSVIFATIAYFIYVLIWASPNAISLFRFSPFRFSLFAFRFLILTYPMAIFKLLPATAGAGVIPAYLFLNLHRLGARFILGIRISLRQHVGTFFS